MEKGLDVTFKEVGNPKEFFNSNPKIFSELVEIVRDAFGTEMGEQDVYEHLTEPDKVFLLEGGSECVGMYSFNSINLGEHSMLFVEGMAVHPSFQGKEIFSSITSKIWKGEKFIGLKTQSPRMYRALEKFCQGDLCPAQELACVPQLFHVKEMLSESLGIEIDSFGVARNLYGKSLYASEQTHPITSNLFNDHLKINYDAGDSVICVGEIPRGNLESKVE